MATAERAAIYRVKCYTWPLGPATELEYKKKYTGAGGRRRPWRTKTRTRRLKRSERRGRQRLKQRRRNKWRKTYTRRKVEAVEDKEQDEKAKTTTKKPQMEKNK
jgi:hypothetical protein